MTNLQLLKELKYLSRSFSTCSIVMASGKDNKKKRQERKRREDKDWQNRKSLNPFTRNIGAARQLRGLELDPDDPTFGLEDANVAFGNLDHSLEEMRDRSKAFRKQQRADEEFQKDLAKKKIIQKNMFPKPEHPALLTWMEMEMIRYLHSKDPTEWSYERLAESFPATKGVIHKVVKSKTLLCKDRIREYNQEVVSNWKKLSKKQLELEPKYEQHLKSNNGNLKLTPGEKSLAEQEIMVKFERSLSVPKPAIPGEFASIIVNYNKKIAKRETENKSVQAQEVFEMASLFGDNSIPGTPVMNEVSPYSETALLATNIDLSKEKRMDVEKFRKQYLKRDGEKKSKKENIEDPNPFREKYLEWVKKEEDKSKYASKSVQKIEASEVSNIEKEASFLYENVEEEIDVKVSETGQTYVFDPESGYKQPYINPDNPDFIEIPKQLKNKYKLFQVGDSYYDNEGDFLFRVPGLV